MMHMELISTPDICIKCPERFTVGVSYAILGIFHNCFVVEDNEGNRALVLASRFQ